MNLTTTQEQFHCNYIDEDIFFVTLKGKLIYNHVQNANMLIVQTETNPNLKNIRYYDFEGINIYVILTQMFNQGIN